MLKIRSLAKNTNYNATVSMNYANFRQLIVIILNKGITAGAKTVVACTVLWSVSIICAAAPPYEGNSAGSYTGDFRSISSEDLLTHYYQTVPKKPNETRVVVFEHKLSRASSYVEYSKISRASKPKLPVESSLRVSANEFYDVTVFRKTRSILSKKLLDDFNASPQLLEMDVVARSSLYYDLVIKLQKQLMRDTDVVLYDIKDVELFHTGVGGRTALLFSMLPDDLILPPGLAAIRDDYMTVVNTENGKFVKFKFNQHAELLERMLSFFGSYEFHGLTVIHPHISELAFSHIVRSPELMAKSRITYSGVRLEQAQADIIARAANNIVDAHGRNDNVEVREWGRSNLPQQIDSLLQAHASKLVLDACLDEAVDEGYETDVSDESGGS